MSSNSLLGDSVQEVSDLKAPVENLDLAMFQNIEFEEKVIKQEPLDIQILPSKRIKLENIEIHDIKQEPLDNQILPSKRIKLENIEIHDINQEPLANQSLPSKRIRLENIEIHDIKQEFLYNQILPSKRIKLVNIETHDIKQEPLYNQILPSKRIKLENIEIHDIKQEHHEEENHHVAFESDLDVAREFKQKMEGDIWKLFEELDKEKSEKSPLDFSLSKSLKIKKFVNEIAELDPGQTRYQISKENVALKTKIVKIREDDKIAMSLNAKTHEKALNDNTNQLVNTKRQPKIKPIVEKIAQLDPGQISYQMSREIFSLETKIVKITEDHKIAMSQSAKTHQKALNDYKNELAIIKQELQSAKVTNQELLQKNEEFGMNKNAFASTDSLEKDVEIKPFSCKNCDKSLSEALDNSDHELNRLPTVPEYSPTRPEYLPTTIEYSPKRPEYLPTGTECLPTVPEYSPTRPEYSPNSDHKLNRLPTVPIYSPTRPEYMPTTIEYSPTRPEY